MIRKPLDQIRFLRRFYSAFNAAASQPEQILQAGLEALNRLLGFDTVSLFLWDRKARLLRMEYMLFKGELMPGEEEIPVGHGTDLDRLASGTSATLAATSPLGEVVYVPLWLRREFFGVVRLGPSARGHGSPISLRRNSALLEDMASALVLHVEQAYILMRHEDQLRDLKALGEVTATVEESLKLREMLEAVSLSVLRNMGFDRVRFYLVDGSTDTLTGAVGAEIPGRTLHLDAERHPLHKGHSALVDSVLSARPQVSIEGAGQSIACIPLVLKGKPIGVCVADNLLSQQRITPEKLEAMTAVAGQVALAVSNARLFEEIEEQAITDGLTKLYVVRYFNQRLQEEVDRAERYTYPLGLVMLDVDRFKKFNDTYGHPMGDRVLEYIGQTIRANIRKVDLAARYGGDEMVILLPDISEQEAWIMTGRVFKALNQCALTVPGGPTVPVTVSMGVAMYPQDTNTGKGLIECADHALYWAKAHGRADVCFYRTIASSDKKNAKIS